MNWTYSWKYHYQVPLVVEKNSTADFLFQKDTGA